MLAAFFEGGHTVIGMWNEAPGVRPGQQVDVRWGSLGQVRAVIVEVSDAGRVWIKRWEQEAQRWSQARIAEFWAGEWHV